MARPFADAPCATHGAATYRLGISLGAGSLGWCAVRLNEDGDPASLLDGGVRVFSDGRHPKTGSPLALDRRNARGMRRRRDRYLRRREVLLQELVRYRLMPSDDLTRKHLEQADPYLTRAAALDERVPLHHFGRALFHLNQRRGFKSNRKIDASCDDIELGLVARGSSNLDAAMVAAGARTYGEYLALRHSLAPSKHNATERHTRVRRLEESGDYAFFPLRRHLEWEFDALWDSQQFHYPDVLTEEARSRLRRIIFFQRAFKLPPPGRCAYTTQTRIAQAHPVFQRLCLIKTINELKIEQIARAPRSLTLSERDAILGAFRTRKATKRQMNWNAMRSAAGLPAHCRFVGEDEKGKGIAGDPLEAELVALYGADWRTLTPAEQWRIVSRLVHEEDYSVLLDFLQGEIGLKKEKAVGLAAARLPPGYARIGEMAATRILAQLEADVISEREAVVRCGWDTLGSGAAELFDQLPYYGEVLEHQIPPGTQDPADRPEQCFGRVSNPTLHIAFGQLRRLVNNLSERHGRPHEIFVELSRKLKLSGKQRQKANRVAAIKASLAVKRGAVLQSIGVENTGANRAILRAWEDLHPDPDARKCVYTGVPIDISMLFSGETAIDHILPIAATLDDSNANRLLAIASGKRAKGGRTPYQAFGVEAEWEAILERAQALPPNKRWRFAPDALTRFGSDHALLARQFEDSSHMAGLVHGYLAALYREVDEGGKKVRCISDQVTDMLRRQWDVNALLPDADFVKTNRPKSRLDHRHRLIDAFATAFVEPAFMRRVAVAAGEHDLFAIPPSSGVIPEPWSGFRRDLQALLERVIVSHRPDHAGLPTSAERSAGRDRTAGRLHNDTALGFTGEVDANGNELVVHRVPLASLADDQTFAGVRDRRLREELVGAVRDKCGKERRTTLRQFGEDRPAYRDIRHVRIIEPAKTVKIRDKAGRPYKGFKGNSIHHMDIWRLPDGEWVSQWEDSDGNEISSAVQMFYAHQTQSGAPEPRPHPAARKILRLHQNDMIALEHPLYGECICRVVKLRETGQVTLARHSDGGNLISRNKSAEDSFKYFSPSASGLKKARARRIRVDETGRVWDPGPRD